MDNCLRTKNKYTFNPNNNFLAIILNNGVANYLIVKINEMTIRFNAYSSEVKTH